MYRRGGTNTFMPDGNDLQMPGKTGLYVIGGIVKHLGAPHGHRLLDGQLLSPPVGHGLLGAGLCRLGIPEPHHRPAGLGARPLRVSRRRLDGEPISDGRRAS